MARFVLMDEGDPSKRFVLQEEPGAPQKEAVQSIGETIAGIPRQLGLTARAGLQGLGGLVGVLSDPIAATANLTGIPKRLTGSDIPFARDTAKGLSDTIGLPTPRTPTERVAGQTAEMMAGVGGGLGTGRLLSSLGGATARQVGEVLSQAPREQLGAAIGGGVAGGSAREGGSGAGGEFAASLLGSVAGGLVPAGVDRVSQSVSRLVAPRLSPQQIDINLSAALAKQGVDWAALSPNVQASLRNELGSALQVGDQINPEALRRLADYRTVGATPTRGRVTLDPVQITREKNLSKMAANSGQSELYGLPALENQNNKVLIDTLNAVRGEPVKLNDAGGAALNTILGKDTWYSTLESELHKTARASAGRNIPLDRERFVYGAYERLAQENKGAFLPDNINTLLENIRNGVIKKGGVEYQVPFDVDTIDALKTTIAKATRASRDGNERAALGIVRSALEDIQPAANPMKTALGGQQLVTAAQGAATAAADNLPADAMKAFDAARAVARERRTWQESSKAVKAAIDGAEPDQFIQRFLLSKQATEADARALAQELTQNPAAKDMVRRSIVEYLKDQALNKAADEVGKFSQSGYNNALRDIRDKLPAFFSADEIAKLQAAGRVASYEMFQPVGSAVNNSNSGALVLGRALDGIVGISRFLPGGRALVADPLQQIQVRIGSGSAQNVLPGLLATKKTPVLTGSALLPAAYSAGLLSAP